MWGRLRREKPAFYADFSLYHQARLHLQKGDAKQARELVATLERDYVDSTLAPKWQALFPDDKAGADSASIVTTP